MSEKPKAKGKKILAEQAPTAPEISVEDQLGAARGRVALLEQGYSIKSQESRQLLVEEHDLTRKVESLKSDYAMYVHKIVINPELSMLALIESEENSRKETASNLQVSNEAQLEEIESALISQAVESDLCDKMIRRTEEEFEKLLSEKREKLKTVRAMETELRNECNTELVNICMSIENLCD